MLWPWVMTAPCQAQQLPLQMTHLPLLQPQVYWHVTASDLDTHACEQIEGRMRLRFHFLWNSDQFLFSLAIHFNSWNLNLSQRIFSYNTWILESWLWRNLHLQKLIFLFLQGVNYLRKKKSMTFSCLFYSLFILNQTWTNKKHTWLVSSKTELGEK